VSHPLDLVGLGLALAVVLALVVLAVAVSRHRPAQPPSSRRARLTRGVYGGGARGYQRYLIRGLRAGRPRPSRRRRRRR